MNKKKEAKFLEKKKKNEENKKILESLSKNILPSEIMSSFVSIKDLNKRKKEKKPKKPLGDENSPNENEEEIYDQNEEQKNPKKIFSEENQKKENKPMPNIFETNLYINEELPLQNEKKDNKSAKLNTLDELELMTKKAIPNYNFDTFGSKDFKKSMKSIDDASNMQKNKENMSDSDENEPLFVDEECQLFSSEISQLYRNQITREKNQEENRRKLPIYLKESEIIDSINNNFITIICGETGSGKSTQVPQFLYEAGYSNKNGPNPGKIGITQPRRIAAIALAKRVAEEMNLTIGQDIAYQVRHETSHFNENTKIKFMTDGILLNEMTSDYLLSEYSVIIIDEAHERKINTDLLIGLLSKVVHVRSLNAKEERKNREISQKKFENNPLRLVIMSATLRVEDFTNNKMLFPKKINVINVESRQFPVSVYFNKFTPDDYFEDALKKCKKIHKTLPSGDVLVFLTGEREIKEFCFKLESELSREEADEINDEDEDFVSKTNNKKDEKKTKIIKEKKNIYSLDSDDDEIDDHENSQENIKKDGVDEQNNKKQIIHLTKDIPSRFIIYPLFSKLSFAEQERIFASHEENTRMFVISTNVAETSLTIPNIKYVIDCGKEKKKNYHNKLLISYYTINWISQASADQRSGRAGRTGPGFCYRLYSTPVYGNIFKKFSDPEISNAPVESVILQLKAIGIVNTMNFPFPTPPDFEFLRAAIISLVKLKALSINNEKDEQNFAEIIEKKLKENIDHTTLTELGKVLVYIPLHPKFAKMLLEARKRECLGYMLLIVCALSVDQLCRNEKINLDQDNTQKNEKIEIEDNSDEEIDSFKNQIEALKEKKELIEKKKKLYFQQIKEYKQRYSQFMLGKSDLFFLMNLLGKFIHFMNNLKNQSVDSAILEFSNVFHLQVKALKEIYYNFHQILMILTDLIESEKEKENLKLFFQNYTFPNNLQQDLLVEIIIENFIEKCARKIKYTEGNKQKTAYEVLDSEIPAYIHPTSFNSSSMPDFLVYTELFFSKKCYMKNITIVQDLSLLFKYDTVRRNKTATILKNPEPFYSEKKDRLIAWASSEFGKKKWELSLFEHYYEEDMLEQYYWFAYYLLDGQIFKFFQAFKKLYACNLKSIKINNMAVNVQRIVNKLRINRINKKVHLIEKWKNDKKFLLDEILLWIKPEFHQKIKEKWPPNF